MSLGGDDRTKHDIHSSMERSCNSTPSSKCFTISKASTPVSVDGATLKTIASFACCGTNIGKMRISCFGHWQAKVQTRDCRHVSFKACCLVRVGVGRGDGCHETDSSFHAITKVSRIIDASAVLTISINELVDAAHHHDPILEISQEHLGD